MKANKLLFIIVVFLLSQFSFAQFYLGPHIGFKASGLKGTVKISFQGQVGSSNVADAGNTGFNAGITTGYSIVFPGSIYILDIGLEASYSSFSYFEEAYNDANGSGKFTADGLDGLRTSIISIDLVPIHRLSFPGFRLLSPYAGVGLGVNLMFTSDGTQSVQGQSLTYTGVSEVKLGLLVFYGVVFDMSSLVKPFIQFKHFIPFGSETKFVESISQSNGGGSQAVGISMTDVPGYFNINAGVRFVL